MMTKLRPFVRPFLKEASEMFEMHIYTMGDRPYALEMAKLLDPQGEYFNSKVISRDDGTQKHQKGLDVVLGQESAVLILDDTEHFGFSCKSLAELKSDENETDGALAKILHVLKQKDQEDLVDRDVLSTVRSEVLSGCVILFSRICHGALPSLQKMAEQMRATCLTEIDSSVTHVVATDVGTEKSRTQLSVLDCYLHISAEQCAKFTSLLEESSISRRSQKLNLKCRGKQCNFPAWQS
ncbi:hypothetical protein Fmac_021788 [Flemingia macrophylla]|uniref:protein-serine/threonine phosphatase n=1 Tax=Flemingia macrophylla TaxID=520843 RepID=A0ABD1LXU6_9FABA